MTKSRPDEKQAEIREFVAEEIGAIAGGRVCNNGDMEVNGHCGVGGPRIQDLTRFMK